MSHVTKALNSINTHEYYRMAKLRVGNGAEVWVLDHKAWSVAARNSSNHCEKRVLYNGLMHAWNTGNPTFTVVLITGSKYHKWFQINVNGKKIYVHDSEVVRC